MSESVYFYAGEIRHAGCDGRVKIARESALAGTYRHECDRCEEWWVS